MCRASVVHHSAEKKRTSDHPLSYFLSRLYLWIYLPSFPPSPRPAPHSSPPLPFHSPFFLLPILNFSHLTCPRGPSPPRPPPDSKGHFSNKNQTLTPLLLSTPLHPPTPPPIQLHSPSPFLLVSPRFPDFVSD